MTDTFTCFVIGETSLLIKCSETLLERGHTILGVVSSEPDIIQWAQRQGIQTLALDAQLEDRLTSTVFDYLFSIANFSILSNNIIAAPRKFAVSFHDGPLPRYAGMNATSWALLNREQNYGITWYKMTGAVDKGDILKQYRVSITDNETSVSLNAKCFEAGIASFAELVDELANENTYPQGQNLARRTYFSKFMRPHRAAIISWDSSAATLSALTRALHFGPYPNPLCLPKIKISDEYFIVPEVRVTDMPSTDPPGTITFINQKHIRVATQTFDVELHKVLSIEGLPEAMTTLIQKYSLSAGFRFENLDNATVDRISDFNALIAKHEHFWVGQLSKLEFVNVHYARRDASATACGQYRHAALDVPENFFRQLTDRHHAPRLFMAGAFAVFMGRHGGKHAFTLGLNAAVPGDIPDGAQLFARYVPVHIAFTPEDTFEHAVNRTVHAFKQAQQCKTYARDVFRRYPALHHIVRQTGQPVYPIHVALTDTLRGCREQPGSLVTLHVARDRNVCTLVYDTCAIADENINLLKEQFFSFLESASSGSGQQVSRISLLAAQEKTTLLHAWNNTHADFPSTKCIHHLLEEQAQKTPHTTAIICGGETLTYAELNRRANQLARSLQSSGVMPETLVGVFLHRSVKLMVAILGILKAGGAFVPLDPAFPTSRIAFMISNSQCPVIITENRLKEELIPARTNLVIIDDAEDAIARKSANNLSANIDPHNLAYVIYTSGSTGTPKGVMIQHSNVINFFKGMDRHIPFDPPGVWLAVTSLSFDISVLELLWTLGHGFTVVICTEKADHISIAHNIRKHHVSHLQCTPSMARILELAEESRDALRSLDCLMVGGEALPANLARQLKDIVTGDILNMYGPTETTIWSSVYKIDGESESVPIGRPIINTEMFILDANQELVPIGVPGELCIGGEGVARGYLGQAQLTAKKFIKNPFNGNNGRIYRTGDLACYRKDGMLQFLGRLDHQVKIRGYRIEPGEVETMLVQHPAIGEAVVIAREDRPGDKRLVAYLTNAADAFPSLGDLRGFLKEKLPDYMIPAAFVLLKKLPLTPNGKVDRRALPAPELIAAERTQYYHAPRSPVEKALAALWSQVLNNGRVGIHDNFFELGGNSLSAVQITLQIKQRFSVELSLQSFFNAATLEDMAGILEHKLAGKRRPT